MAHEIDFTTQAQGSAMFAYQPAWHGFGTVVSEAQTSADALRIAGLDWDVQLTDLAADMGEDAATRYLPISTHRATYRADTGMALGAVGLRYQPLQNREAFAWMDEVVGGDVTLGAPPKGGDHVGDATELIVAIRDLGGTAATRVAGRFPPGRGAGWG